MPFLNKFFGKQSKGPAEAILSVHIRNDFLRVVKGSKEKGKIIVSAFANKKIFSQDKAYSLLADKLKELLRECGLLEEKKLKKLRIYSILSGSDVCVRVFKIPFMPKDEVPQAVKAKIKEIVSYPLEEIVFDFSILDQVQERGVSKLNIVFMAIQKSSFLQYLDIFKNIGVQPHLLTSPCFCEWNLLKGLGLGESTLSLILVSVDSEDTDISVLREGKLVFTRNIPFGERDFTEALKNELNTTWEEAEEIKGQCGLLTETISVKYKYSPQRVAAALMREAEVLFREIDLTAHHYYQITHGEGIDKYILLGCGMQIKGLKEFLTQKLDIPVEELRIPPDRLEVISDRKDEFEKNLPLYLPSLGAILGNPEDTNLMSFGQRRTQKKFTVSKFTFVPSLANLLLVIIFSLIIIISVLLKGQNIYYRSQINYNKAAWKQREQSLYKSVQLKRQLELLEFKKKIYSQLRETSIFYPEIILGISNSIPEDKLFLDSLNFLKPPSGKVQITIQGTVQDPTYSTANFMLALEKTGYFENLSFMTSGRPAVREGMAGGMVFTIKGEVKSKNK